MRRRDLLTGGIALVGAALAPSALAQAPPTRAAVVIGVNKTGALPVLGAAASGARQVAEWLKGQNFHVKLLVDDAGPVRIVDIKQAVGEIVDRGTYEQLVIYFSGHGFLSGFTEWWMLSNAPDDPDEAVSVVESAILAKESGIPSVVFISDACRSIPGTLGVSRVDGSLIFPNSGPASQSVEVNVDRFHAALPGKPALELPVDKSTSIYEGIYTTCFLNAFKRPDADMILPLDNGDRVVPNRRLKGYLRREVQKAAQARNITLNQVPDADVVSDEQTYIGRIAPDPVIFQPPPAPGQATIFDVAGSELERVAGLSFAPETAPAPVNRNMAVEAGFNTARDAVLSAQRASPDTPIDTGFIVSGAEVADAVGHPSTTVEIVSRGEQTVVRVRPERQGASVALRFADGSGTVTAALRSFVGNVTVKEGGISNVSYVPSPENWRRQDYEQVRERLDELRAVVSAAAQYGVFRIEGGKDSRERTAERLADRIRILKGLDPTLGLYAAYAYAEAGLINQVRSVRDYMRGDLETELFDIALLAGDLTGQSTGDRSGLVPFCPMLYQGWSLLRVKDVRLPPPVEEARRRLRPALWTTFEREGMTVVSEALRRGELW